MRVGGCPKENQEDNHLITGFRKLDLTLPSIRIVKEIVAIAVLSFYLLCATQLTELFKLPALIEHYIEHKAEDESLSLFEFLHIHYAYALTVDDDFEKDMRLPFKMLSPTFCTYVSICQKLPNIILSIRELSSKCRVQIVSLDIIYCPTYFGCIWQPPRSC
jgi:hypothetical protein